jgi:hypothetical protein
MRRQKRPKYRREDRRKLMEWYAGVLGFERCKGERTVSQTEMLRRLEGAGKKVSLVLLPPQGGDPPGRSRPWTRSKE